MVTRLLVLVPDGAADPAGTLSRARTPALDRLAHRARLTTIPSGLPAASEVGIPALLGRALGRAPARGAVEAAAVDVPVAAGEAAWRLDVTWAGGDAEAGGDADPAALARALSDRLGARVRPLRADRYLLVGPAAWLHERAWTARLHAITATAGRTPRVWGGGAPPTWPALAWTTAVVCAGSGAAAGVARLLGARVTSPPGATGFPDSDLDAKTAAAAALVREGRHTLVAVHVGGPDEAAHARDADTKRRAVERFDRRVVAPLAALAGEHGIPLLVAPDHHTDPRTGTHLDRPVPAWANEPVTATTAWEAVAGRLEPEVSRR